MNQNYEHPQDIWGLEEIQKHYKISFSRAKRLVREKGFPQPIIGPRSRRWVASQVISHMESRTRAETGIRNIQDPILVFGDSRPRREAY